MAFPNFCLFNDPTPSFARGGRGAGAGGVVAVPGLAAGGGFRIGLTPRSQRELRELRDLTRYRAQLVSEATRVANRVHKRP
jgi:hypothetical protein